MSDKDPREALLSGVTVGRLREALAGHPDDMPVIVLGEHGQDGETPVSGVVEIWYEPVSTWGGNVYPDFDDPDEPYGAPETAVRCLFIEGIN